MVGGGMLQAWPEPVVRVQSLAESGAAVIPDRYIKPPSERPQLSNNADVAFTGAGGLSIPVIDLGELSAGGAVECRAIIRSISDACRNWGFFQVVNHGVSAELMARVRFVWREFFNLPMEMKQQHANSPATYEGYGSRTGTEKGAILDWGDYYFLHFLPASLRNHDKWPAVPTSCKETIEEYSRETLKLCQVLMKVMSLSLGLDVGELQRAFGGEDNVGACMRVNYYPPCPQPELTLSLSAHSDPGGLTVLLADQVAGLQVRKGSSWVVVQPEPNALVVNVGDQIQVLSNATYKSVEHRVVANVARERLSIVFFYNPRSDIPLAPIPQLVSPENPSLYQPMTFGQYRMYIRQKGPRGKTQVESLKAK